MILTIYKGRKDGEILLGSKDKRFHEAWGNVYSIPSGVIYENLAQIASWANNELGEELLLEVD